MAADNRNEFRMTDSFFSCSSLRSRSTSVRRSCTSERKNSDQPVLGPPSLSRGLSEPLCSAYPCVTLLRVALEYFNIRSSCLFTFSLRLPYPRREKHTFAPLTFQNFQIFAHFGEICRSSQNVAEISRNSQIFR